MPNFHGYETPDRRTSPQWGPTYFDRDGKSTLAKDPAFDEMLDHRRRSWSTARRLREAGEVPHHLRRRVSRRTRSTPEGGHAHGRRVARSACQGRRGEVRRSAPRRCRCPTTRPTTYGRGYLTGTVVGIAAQQQEPERGLGAGEVPDHRHRRGGRLRQRHPQRAVHAGGAEVAEAGRRPARSGPSSTSRRTRTAAPLPPSVNGGAYVSSRSRTSRYASRPARSPTSTRACARPTSRSTPTSAGRRTDGAAMAHDHRACAAPQAPPASGCARSASSPPG